MTQPDSPPLCGICQDEGWVCENHPNEAWPSLCECGAGMPCGVCRKRPAPDSIMSARELCAQLLSHTTSVHNVELIKAHDEAVRNAALEEAADMVFEKQYPTYGDAERISKSIRDLKTSKEAL